MANYKREDELLMHCSKCDIGIYEADNYFDINDIILCESCALDCQHRAGRPVYSSGDNWEGLL